MIQKPLSRRAIAGDSPGFEHNRTVNNRGYRPSAHLRCRRRVGTEWRDHADAAGGALMHDSETYEPQGDSPGFEHNQTVNNRGYRPSAQ